MFTLRLRSAYIKKAYSKNETSAGSGCLGPESIRPACPTHITINTRTTVRVTVTVTEIRA